jgi:hypothetical protein
MYSLLLTSNVWYEEIATLCVFSSHGDNIWEPLVRHECLATFVRFIPEGIVEYQIVLHPVHAFMFI